MTINEFIQNRNGNGTIGGVAHRLWTARWAYPEVALKYGMEVRQRFLIEALIAHGGNQCRTAEAVNVSWNTVYRAVQAFGLSVRDIRKYARQAQEAQ